MPPKKAKKGKKDDEDAVWASKEKESSTNLGTVNVGSDDDEPVSRNKPKKAAFGFSAVAPVDQADDSDEAAKNEEEDENFGGLMSTLQKASKKSKSKKDKKKSKNNFSDDEEPAGLADSSTLQASAEPDMDDLYPETPAEKKLKKTKKKVIKIDDQATALSEEEERNEASQSNQVKITSDPDIDELYPEPAVGKKGKKGKKKDHKQPLDDLDDDEILEQARKAREEAEAKLKLDQASSPPLKSEEATIPAEPTGVLSKKEKEKLKKEKEKAKKKAQAAAKKVMGDNADPSTSQPSSINQVAAAPSDVVTQPAEGLAVPAPDQEAGEVDNAGQVGGTSKNKKKKRLAKRQLSLRKKNLRKK